MQKWLVDSMLQPYGQEWIQLGSYHGPEVKGSKLVKNVKHDLVGIRVLQPNPGCILLRFQMCRYEKCARTGRLIPNGPLPLTCHRTYITCLDWMEVEFTKFNSPSAMGDMFVSVLRDWAANPRLPRDNGTLSDRMKQLIAQKKLRDMIYKYRKTFARATPLITVFPVQGGKTFTPATFRSPKTVWVPRK